MDPRPAALRQLRTMHAIFVVVIFMWAYVSEITARAGSETTQTLVIAIAIVAGLELILAYYSRAKRAIPAIEKLQRDPNDAVAMLQWRSGTILSMVLAMSVALYGLVLRTVGAGRRVSWPFFLVALIFLMVWRPRLDLNSNTLAPSKSQ
jgi:hypothetical protein